MKSLRYAKLGAVFALALGAAVPASLIVATPAAAHEQYRGNDHRGDHGNFRGDHRGFDHHNYRGHWEMRNHRWQWFDGFWFGR
ncbi:MAG TPA: hypothetical protein VHU87_12810 [Rhizomicrobium sp.]|jgi:hypothetical protein|nr:hypothetical protein [Rhizomicrobium sp.]